MRRFIIVILALLLVLAFSTALANSASDPLISLSYIQNSFLPGLKSSGEKALDGAFDGIRDQAASRVEKIYENYAPGSGLTVYSGTESYVPLYMLPYSRLEISSGGSIVLSSGDMKIESISGSVVDVSSGSEVKAGTTLQRGVRYFCCENTVAVYRVQSSGQCMVDGYHAYTGGYRTDAMAYADVSQSDWYRDYAAWIWQRKVYFDISNNAFRPNDPALRADLVYALWRISGAPAPTSKAGFNDLKEDWYRDAVCWAAENGIVNGYSATVFGPGDKVSREQIATIMYRYASWLGQSTGGTKDLSVFSDSGAVSSWAKTAMSWAYGRGLINGMTQTTLVPGGTATRAQVAAILSRF